MDAQTFIWLMLTNLFMWHIHFKNLLAAGFFNEQIRGSVSLSNVAVMGVEPVIVSWQDRLFNLLFWWQPCISKCICKEGTADPLKSKNWQ